MSKQRASGKAARTGASAIKRRSKLKLPASSVGLKQSTATKQRVVERCATANATPVDASAGDKQPRTNKHKWSNKQRCLVFSGRGISHRHRHLMTDMRSMLPHAKSEPKMERKDEKRVINEICEMRNCNKCMFFEPRREHLYLWLANVPDGPTAQFLVENVHTMTELRMTGNCLRGSRPLLVFDRHIESAPYLQLIRELLVQVFGTPLMHPRSQPFIDHVLLFGWLDCRLWMRHYQMVDESGALAEVGPRLVLNPIKLLAGSFRGDVLWKNPHFCSPSSRRMMLKLAKAGVYADRKQSRLDSQAQRPGVDETVHVHVTDDVFNPVVTLEPASKRAVGASGQRLDQESVVSMMNECIRDDEETASSKSPASAGRKLKRGKLNSNKTKSIKKHKTTI